MLRSAMASQAEEALLSFANVLEGLERTGMWLLEFDETSQEWRLEALKGPNKGRAAEPRRGAKQHSPCLFTAPRATPIHLNRET